MFHPLSVVELQIPASMHSSPAGMTLRLDNIEICKQALVKMGVNCAQVSALQLRDGDTAAQARIRLLAYCITMSLVHAYQANVILQLVQRQGLAVEHRVADWINQLLGHGVRYLSVLCMFARGLLFFIWYLHFVILCQRRPITAKQCF